jgi:hypothetical protein
MEKILAILEKIAILVLVPKLAAYQPYCQSFTRSEPQSAPTYLAHACESCSPASGTFTAVDFIAVNARAVLDS